MSVNRKVTVPVGGLATTLMSSLLPLRGHYSSGGYYRPFLLPLFTACGVEYLSSWLEIPPTPGLEVRRFCHGERRREARE